MTKAKFTLRIDENLSKNSKIRAIEEGKLVNEIIEGSTIKCLEGKIKMLKLMVNQGVS